MIVFYLAVLLSVGLHVATAVQECETLYSPLNGTLVCSNDTHITNTTCISLCDVGYQLVGSSDRICLPNGSWSGERAYCSPLQCPDPIPPENGFIQLPCSNDYTTECNIRCYFSFEQIGNKPIKCALSEDSNITVMWSTSSVTCQRKSVCTNTTCKHGGKCIPISDDDFMCNCTGTFYDGKTCDKGVIVTTDFAKFNITVGQFYEFQVFAKPDKTLIVSPYISGKLACNIGSGIPVYFYPCSVALTRDVNNMKFSMIVFLSGLHFLTLSLSGENAKNFTEPAPMPIITHSTLESNYFKTFSNLQPSCCEINNDQLLQCGVLPGLNPQLISSCGWHKEDDITKYTLGIVYSKLNNVTFPVSVAGLSITDTDIKIPQRIYFCGNCKGMLMDIDKYPENKCYMYKPTGEDSREFVIRQSLSTAFVTEIQNKLLPSWIDLEVTPDSETLTKLSITDYKITLATTTDVTKTPGCESIIIDSIGQFGVLQHDGPLNLTLQASRINYENTYIPSPTKESSVCIAVNLCLGENSPVYIGIPSSAQQSIQKISFIHDLILRGWNIIFHSVSVHKIPILFTFSGKFWNGIHSNYTSSFQANLFHKMEASGSFKYRHNEVSFSFFGNLSHDYVVDKNKVLQANAFGKWIVSVTSLINSVNETLTLSNISTNASIYYNSSEISTCNPQKYPSGTTIKVSYVPRQGQPFYHNLFQLPKDTPHCPMDVFIALDSNKNMSGLSLYSDCLDILYNNLLFQKLAHRMYIPMAPQTLCNQPTKFTVMFPDLQSFGLIIHSTIHDSSNSYLPLGTYFKLLQGYTDTAMSLAYSHSSATKVGLLYSVQVNIMDTSFITKVFLKDNELAFTGSGNISNNDLYYANLQGKASVAMSLWNKLVLEIDGWFPTFAKGFVDILQENVHKRIKKKAEHAKQIKRNVDSQRSMSMESFHLAKSALNNAKQRFYDANNKYKEIQIQTAKTILLLADELFVNKTDELNDTETALNTLCKVQVCLPHCAPATRAQIVDEIVNITIFGFCEYICNVTTEVMRVALNKLNEEQNLQAAQTEYNVAEKINNASNENYLAIMNIIKDDLRLLNLTEKHNLTDIFNITNITFSVTTTTQSLSAIPINIIFDCSYLQQQFMFTTSYNFEEKKIDLLVDDIIDYILLKKGNSTNSRHKRAKEKDNNNLPDCSCSNGQVIDEENGRCVYPQHCPNPDPCTLPPYKGPCKGQISKYFYNITSQKCELFYYGGCLSNENNFYSLSACEEKCSKCPPTCSLDYCTIKRGAVCSIPSLQHSTCPGGCNVSNCFACYFSYNILPFPEEAESCPANCTVIREELDKNCMKKWGRCVHRVYSRLYNQIQSHEKTSTNFHCWKYPCNMQY